MCSFLSWTKKDAFQVWIISLIEVNKQVAAAVRNMAGLRFFCLVAHPHRKLNPSRFVWGQRVMPGNSPGLSSWVFWYVCFSPPLFPFFPCLALQVIFQKGLNVIELFIGRFWRFISVQGFFWADTVTTSRGGKKSPFKTLLFLRFY